jgi:hypothetical protein
MVKAGRKPIPKSQAEGPIAGLLAVRTRKSKSRPKPTPKQSAEIAELARRFSHGLELFAEGSQRLLRPRLRLPEGVGRSPRKQRRVVQHYQGDRVQIVLAKEYPDGVPSKKELSNSELVNVVRKRLEEDPKKTGLAIPDPKTILREAGRIPRKK